MVKTFPRGGGTIPHRKNSTENKEIVAMEAPESVVIPLSQHIGAPCEPIVAIGDAVKIGQKIGDSKQFISAPVHASVSGKVVAIEERPLLNGEKVLSVVINNDGQDQVYNGSSKDYAKLSAQEIVQIIKNCGIVGMGGAGFPAYVKLSPRKPVDTVIINGAECEPYLTCDHRLMVEQPKEMLDGLKAIMKAVGADTGIIGIENNKPDAIEALRQMVTEQAEITIVPMKVKYPQGAEKQLIKAVTGREVPSGCLPAEVGCIVSNVHTAISIAESINQGIGLYQRVITVSGNCVYDPRNVLVRIGTPIEQVIEFCGGMVTSSPAAIIGGGPMTGKVITDLNAPVVKNLSGVLVLGEDEVSYEKNDPCIRCARCIDNCPMGLQPVFLAAFSDKDLLDKAEQYNIMDCIECGLCSYVCPSHRGLCASIQNGKIAVNARNKAV